MKHKEMVLAGNWEKQTFDLVPAMQDDPLQESKGLTFYKDQIEQVKAINPDLTFSFKRWPCLTIMNGEETVAVVTHPSHEQKTEHLRSFGCTAALFNGAFYDKEILEDVKKILPIFNAEFKDMKMREDLGEKAEVANYSLKRLHADAFDHVHFAELRSLYTKPATLATNFMKVNGYPKGWIDGDRDRNISEEYINLLKTDPSFFRFSGKDDPELNRKLQESMKVLDDSVPADKKKNLMSKDEAQRIKDQHDADLKAERELVEQFMKEHDLYWHRKRGNPYDNNAKHGYLGTKYGTTLVKYQVGSGDIHVNAAGMHNEAALAFAAKLAFERYGHDKVYWDVSKKFRKNTSTEELGLIADKTLTSLIKAGFDPEQIVFPKDLQYLVQAKIDELQNTAAFTQATPEQALEAQKVMEDLALESQKNDTNTPVTAVDEDIPAEAPVPGVEGENSPTVADPSAPAPDASESVPASDSPAPAKIDQPAKPTVNVVNDCALIFNAENNTYQLYAMGPKAPMGNPEHMAKVFNKLAEKINPDEPAAVLAMVKGCWKIDKKLYTLAEIKSHEEGVLNSYEGTAKERAKLFKEDFNYKFAYEVLQNLKNPVAEPESTPEPSVPDEPVSSPKVDIGGFDVDDVVSEDAEPYPDYEAAERAAAADLDQLGALDSPDYLDLQKARQQARVADEPELNNKADTGSGDKPETFDDSKALAEIEKANKLAAENLNKAMAKKATNKTTNKETI
ncbi:hypothetical protein [Pseudomonas sp. NBRC 111121]|uniref:hypothetical protein n=1 Tax=Pseudomonas sp. NBRC 111121 TaxID=1661036 RepID=UPI000760C17D|nr:hypothetical protein [Pseudomonas sp. NBRC 111121]